MQSAKNNSDQLWALVDMGSNGIRLSITNLAPPTARTLPTIYQSRLGISLYDAQYDSATGKKQPIPQVVTDEVVACLKRFKTTCLDFGVPQSNHKILATEATRTALNASGFIGQIENALNDSTDSKSWKIELLAKEDEGRIGALGVISSVGVSGVEGLVMDLGGGSTQITWIVSKDGSMATSPIGSVSFPYGAAALTRLLTSITNSSKTEKDEQKSREDLHQKIVGEIQSAYNDLQLPDSLRQKARHPGLTLYLSGGGFRGWGYLLLSSHRIRPYPVPIVNGFAASVKDFKNTELITYLADAQLNSSSSDDKSVDVFRVSSRRASQVPAVSFLISALTTAIPFISQIRICQGGVREGALFSILPESIRSEDPMCAGSASFSLDPPSIPYFTDLLASSLPADCSERDRSTPPLLKQKSLLTALANLMWLHQTHSKETAAVNALQTPLTGVLANVHGAGHEERTLLALTLCQRWGGTSNLPPPYDDTAARLELLLGNRETWWAHYLGTIAKVIGEVYPAGRATDPPRIEFRAKWTDGLGKKGNMQGVKIKMKILSEAVDVDAVKELRDEIEKIGKKKNRVGGREYGFGVPIKVDVET